MTNLEEAVKVVLDDFRVQYISQFSTRSGFVLDFANPENKVAIEVDGKKWHSSKWKKKKDMFRDYLLRREGWQIVRIPEDKVSDIAWIKNELSRSNVL